PYAAHAGAVWSLGDATPRRHVRQVWMAEAGAYRTDMFLEAGGGRAGGVKRDERVRGPQGQALGRTPDRRPHPPPPAALLYKAPRHDGTSRPKDEADFAAVSPHLSADARQWLVTALDTAYPGHRWRDALGVVPTR